MSKGLALVTGAASGMGKASAKALQEAGYDLLLCDLNEKLLGETAAELSGGAVETLPMDVTAADLAERLGKALDGRKLAALVHCAGISPTMSDSRRIMEVNLGGTIRVMDAMEDHAADNAAIVLIASNSGHMVGAVIDKEIDAALAANDHMSLLRYADNVETVSYALSKRGVMVLTRREAIRKGKRGIRVNSISPGIIDTPMGNQEMSQQERMQPMIDQSPVQRMGQPSEIGAVARFLCSPQASFMTGSDVLVDGGEMTAGFAIPVAGKAHAGSDGWSD
ncbi:MAG: SDR family oxidoreductase [Novosphingobium sp.]